MATQPIKSLLNSSTFRTMRERAAELQQGKTPEEISAELERVRARNMAENGNCKIECPVCGGVGFVTNPTSGKIEYCPNVNIAELYPARAIGIEPAERALEWSAVLPLDDAPDAPRAVELVRTAMERGYGMVTLWGPPGLAKTLILKIAVAETLRAGRLAGYSHMAKILDFMRAAFDTDNPSSESIRRLEFLSNLHLLGIDEIDRINETPYARERKFLLMDERYESAVSGRTVTIITSNADPDTFPDYLRDRLFDGRNDVLHMRGKSARPAMERE